MSSTIKDLEYNALVATMTDVSLDYFLSREGVEQLLKEHFNNDIIEEVDAELDARYDDGSYDIDAIQCDWKNGAIEELDADTMVAYRWFNMIDSSLSNGQFTQAKVQCSHAGVEYDTAKQYHETFGTCEKLFD